MVKEFLQAKLMELIKCWKSASVPNTHQLVTNLWSQCTSDVPSSLLCLNKTLLTWNSSSAQGLLHCPLPAAVLLPHWMSNLSACSLQLTALPLSFHPAYQNPPKSVCMTTFPVFAHCWAFIQAVSDFASWLLQHHFLDFSSCSLAWFVSPRSAAPKEFCSLAFNSESAHIWLHLSSQT